MKLRRALERLLRDWRDDLSSEWSDVFTDVEPDYGAVDGSLELNGDVIFPGRRGAAPAGARTDAHIFRALDGVKPSQVRVVVMGQDPYTQVRQATGRSFEQGDLSDWLGKPKVTPSLRRIVQMLAVHRTGRAAYTDGVSAWTRVSGDIADGALAIEPPLALWNHWQQQGVIFINAVLTFNRFAPSFQFRGHLPLWRPVVRRLLESLARRTHGHLVGVAWGGKAAAAIKSSGMESAARSAGTWGNTVTIVAGPHPNAPPPNAPPFLTNGDRFREINTAIVAHGGQAIRW